MEHSELKRKTAKGLFWGGFNNGVRQIIAAVLGLVLLSHLSPGDYGLVGMLAIFLGIAEVLQEGGFISALINRREVSDEDYNSVFWVSLSISAVAYLLLFFCAPAIARFYNQEELVLLARVMFLQLPIDAMGVPLIALQVRKMDYREKAIAEISSSVVAGLVAVILAVKGYGYWALAANSLGCAIVMVAVRFITTKWRPFLKVDLQPIKEMFGFSYKMLLSSLVNKIQQNWSSTLIGRYYSKQEVGYYSQGTKWAGMGQIIVTGMLNNVSQQVLARVSEEKARQKTVLRKLLRVSALSIFPVMMGFIIIAPEFITLINPEFIPCVKILQIMCVAGMAGPIISCYSQLAVANGKSNIVLTMSLVKAVVLIATITLCRNLGIYKMAVSYMVIELSFVLIWHLVSAPLVGMKLTSLIRDVFPYFCISAAVMAATWFVCGFIDSMLLRLFAKIAMAVLLYLLAIRLSGSVIYKEAKEFVISTLRKRS